MQFLPSTAQLENSGGKPFPPALEDMLPLRQPSIVRTSSGSERAKPVFEPLPLKGNLLSPPVPTVRISLPRLLLLLASMRQFFLLTHAAQEPPPRRATSEAGALPTPIETNRLLRDGPSMEEKPAATDWQALQRYFLPICSKINDMLYLGPPLQV